VSEKEKNALNEENLEDVAGGYTRVGNNLSFNEDENNIINTYAIGSKRARSRNHTYNKKNADRAEAILLAKGFKNGQL